MAPRKRTAVAAAPQGVDLLLHLYVSGNTDHSVRAITNVRRFCEEHFKDHYVLKVLDVASDPAMAAREDLIALPTLVKKRPVPTQRFIGDMSDQERLARRLPSLDDLLNADPDEPQE